MTDHWTLGALAEHITRLFAETDKRYMALFQAQKEATVVALEGARVATLKAEAAMERRLDLLNEFRQALADQAAGFITRENADSRFDRFDEKIDELKESIDQSKGRAGGISAVGAVLFAAAGLVTAIIAMIIAIV